MFEWGIVKETLIFKLTIWKKSLQLDIESISYYFIKNMEESDNLVCVLK